MKAHSRVIFLRPQTLRERERETRFPLVDEGAVACDPSASQPQYRFRIPLNFVFLVETVSGKGDQ